MRGVTVRVAWALAAPTVRAMRWGPLAVAAGVGVAIVAVPAATTLVLRDEDLVILLRVAAICAGLGVTFLLDDAAAPTIATLPTSRLVRLAVRTVVVLPAVTLWWAAVVTITVAGAAEGIGSGLPLLGVTLEAAAITAIGFGLAALRSRAEDGRRGSTVAGPGLLVLVVAMSFLPERVALFVAPEHSRWEPAHRLWMVVLVAAVVGSIWVSRPQGASSSSG